MVACLACATTGLSWPSTSASAAPAPAPTSTVEASASAPGEGTHLDVELRLTTASTRSGQRSVAALTDAQEAEGVAPASQRMPAASHEVEIIGRDATGADRWRAVQPDPRLVRAEWPGPDGHLEGETIELPEADLTVAVPTGLGITAIEVRGTDLDAELALPAEVAGAAGDGPPGVVTSALGDDTIDIAVLGDGYTAAQQGQFSSDVDTVMAGFFAEDPFAEYESYFQVNEVPVVSAQSGADHLEAVPPTFRSTALGAEYGCFGIARLICLDQAKVYDVLQSRLTPTQYDIILVLVNDPAYGGSGGAVGVASMDAQAVELVLHELGHSFGGLADEYFGNANDPSCVRPAEAGNVTSETQRSKIRWNAWIASSTPIPTTGTTPARPGAYVGGAYCSTGVYRPTYDSKMRSLARPWEQVNTEQLVFRIYDQVATITAWSPATTTLPATGSSPIVLNVATRQPASGTLVPTWTLDGEPIGTGSTGVVARSGLAPGSHEITATVPDPTPMVRTDAFGLLVDEVSWWVPDVRGGFATWGALVDALHLDLLGRAPTNGERNTWNLALTKGTADRGDLADALRRSTDGTAAVDPTVRLYRAFLQRTPDAGGLRYWVGRKRSGSWTLTRMADHFAASSEFLRTYGRLTNRQFVTRIYTDVLGRTADPSGVDYWTRQLDLKRRSRGSVMIGFSESTEYRRKQAETTDAAVAHIFLLGRAPTSGEVATWVARQQAGTPHEDLILEVVASAAYEARKGVG
jgi:hypothetical protein